MGGGDWRELTEGEGPGDRGVTHVKKKRNHKIKPTKCHGDCCCCYCWVTLYNQHRCLSFGEREAGSTTGCCGDDDDSSGGGKSSKSRGVTSILVRIVGTVPKKCFSCPFSAVRLRQYTATCAPLARLFSYRARCTRPVRRT